MTRTTSDKDKAQERYRLNRKYRRRDQSVKWRNSAFDQHDLADKRSLDNVEKRKMYGTGYRCIAIVVEEPRRVLVSEPGEWPQVWETKIFHVEKWTIQKGNRPAGTHYWADWRLTTSDEINRRRTGRDKNRRKSEQFDWDSQDSLLELCTPEHQERMDDFYDSMDDIDWESIFTEEPITMPEPPQLTGRKLLDAMAPQTRTKRVIQPVHQLAVDKKRLQLPKHLRVPEHEEKRHVPGGQRNAHKRRAMVVS